MAVHFLDWRETIPKSASGGVVCIGNFDGVHRGHQSLLVSAKAIGTPLTVVTLEPHPLSLLRPASFLPVLTPVERKADLLQSFGADEVIVLGISREFLQLQPREFFDHVVVKGLRAATLVEGGDFRFGRNRAGDVQLLRELGEPLNIGIRVQPAFQLGSSIVSSSRVRDALLQGQVEDAATYLSRPYRLGGTVGKGRSRGTKIGFPTANMNATDCLVPRDGVYAVRCRAASHTWAAAVNIGPNPTFGEEERKIEVHLIGFSGDLLGTKLEIDFVKRLRATQSFPSVDSLVDQIKLDVDQAAHAVSVTEN